MAARPSATGAGWVVDTSRAISPSQSLSVYVETHARDEFFSRLLKFANEHGFSIRVMRFDSRAEAFDIDLMRGDAWIMGSNKFDKESFLFDLYHAAGATESGGSIERVAVDMTNALMGIGGVSVGRARRAAEGAK